MVVGWAVVLALVTGVGLTMTCALADDWPLDAEDGVSRALESGRTPLGDMLTAWASALGNTWTIVPLCLACMLVLRRALHRWREAPLVGGATSGQSVGFLCTTVVIDRERTEGAHPEPARPTSSLPPG